MTKIVTPKFRVAFAHVHTPNEDGKYGLTMVFDKGTDLSKIKEMVKEAAVEKFTETKGVNTPFKMGDEKADRDEKYEDLRGKILVGCNTKFVPGIVDQSREPIMDMEEFYNGCFARASVSIYAWEYKGKKGVSLNLNNLQKMADGEKYGGSFNPADDFEVVETVEETTMDGDFSL